MIGATFKKRSEKPEPALALPRAPDAEDPVAYDMIVQAKKARIKFDFEHEQGPRLLRGRQHPPEPASTRPRRRSGTPRSTSTSPARGSSTPAR